MSGTSSSVVQGAMPVTARFSADGRVAIVTLSNPPVNTLSISGGVIDLLCTAIADAASQSQVTAVVVMADGRLFSAGVDIGDFDKHPDTLERMRFFTSGVVENAIKPVVIAVQGAALGGGLELAMAGHYRICSVDASFGLPEVSLGLVPGAGGTQRLPRLVGVSKALAMIMSGRAIDAEEALRLGLVDRIARGNLGADAVEWAASLGAPRRTCDLPVERDFASAIAGARSRALNSRLSDAPRFIVDCVESACTQSFREGMLLEGRLFEQLRATEASRGLRHAFHARRRVAHIPGLARNGTEHAIRWVAVVGAGTMGTGIALSLLAGGFPVTLIESRADALGAAAARIKDTVDNDVAKGRSSAEDGAQRLSRLSLAADVDAAAAADLVIEAVFEDMAAKGRVFTQLDRICKSSTILASNTSTLDLNAIAALTARPERVIGMHFFSPANIMRLLEVVRGTKTDPAVLAASLAFAKGIRKTAVVAGVCDGFIGNRIFEEYLRQAYFMLEEGALPEQIDGALERWGMAMGPFRVMDLAGQDIGWSIRRRRAVEQPDRPYSKIPDLVCEQQRFGQKSGAGFYRYPDGRTPEVDPQISAMIVDHSAAIHMTRRVIDDEEIVARCVLAMTNEGARIVADGTAYRPLDIDVVYLDGYGFPGERGGPMFHADRIGLPAVVERCRQFSQGHQGWAWTPAPLLSELAQAGGSFGALDD